MRDYHGYLPGLAPVVAAFKMVLQLAVIMFFCGVLLLYAVLFADFDPPLNEPPCKAGTIVAWLDPCEVRQ